MKVYRIRHLLTGWYFVPSRSIKLSNGYAKSNLSKRGKVYTRRPSLKFIGNTFYNHLAPPRSNRERDYDQERFLVATQECDWVIEEVE